MKTIPFPTTGLPHNSDVQTPETSAEPGPHRAFSHHLAAPILKYLECRSQLLGIEGREALQNMLVVTAWLAMGGASLFAGWLLLASSLVGAFIHYLDWSWVKATAITGAAHLLVAVGAGFVTCRRLNTARWFADSLNELKKDRAWLTT